MPALLTLSAVLLVGAVPLFGRRAAAPVADESQLTELQLAIAKPDAKAESWLLYAQKLQALKRFPQAAMAYQRYLETDPYHRNARLQCANSLAAAADKNNFFAFMETTVASDPKLALEVLSRPDVQGFLAEERFRTLHKVAVAQSMD